MARPVPQLAKLTRPRLYAAVPRERLFRLLDERRRHPCIWIAAPPGAGKTTLAATYFDEAKLSGLWYQLDSGDGDPATFFHYLREAANPYSRKRRPLPLLTHEYLGDLPGFSRRFFRELFLCLPRGAVIVFDNHHEVPRDSRLHEAFAAAIEEVAPNANMLVLSRADPPKEMARALISESITPVGWDELKLTFEETSAIAALRGRADRATVHLLHEQSNGWAAGVRLLLERMRRDGVVYAAEAGETREATFDYFASQIFDSFPRETRELLMAIALLPQVTVPLAQALTGNPNAGLVLESLYHGHLFVDRRPGEHSAYQFHALFRAFLKDRVEREIGVARASELKLKAAQLLAERGSEEEAFSLFTEAGENDRAADLLVRIAPRLIRQGRWRTLQEWQAVLPLQQLGSNPWLGYWLGRAQAAVDPPAARGLLEVAHEAFRERGDRPGQLLGAAAILEALSYEFKNLKLMDPWIERVGHLLEDGMALPSCDDELQVCAALIAALIYRNPDHPMLRRCVTRVEELLGEPFEANLRVAAASILQMYAQSVIDHQAFEIAAREASPLLTSPQVTAARAAFYWASEGYTHYAFCRYRDAITCCEKAQAIAAEHGLDDWALTSGTWRGLSERRAGMLDAAEATVARLAQLRKPSSGHRLANYHMLRPGVAFDCGDTDRGLALALEARACGEHAGQFLHAVLVGTVTANFLIAAGRYPEAKAFLEWACGCIRGPITGHFLGVVALLNAWCAHREADIPRCDAYLRETLERVRDERARVRIRWHLNALSELLPLALTNGIEPQTARMLAREFGIAPASTEMEDWPWPVKVYTLGKFEVLVDGAAPAFGRKLPRKSFSLLQAIIAMGGHDVPEEKLSEALWPDQDGDAGYRALCSALHRLRNVLGDNAAIRQIGGKLSLNPQRCWVDALAFERGLQNAQPRPGESEPAQRRVLALYRGPFLAHEESATWAMPMRERLRGKFVQAVSSAARQLEDSGAFEAAVEHYRRGIDADNLVESFYQGLMRCYAGLDRRSEATSVYRRLKQTLSVVLGVAPSEPTDKLYRQLRLGG